MSSGEDHVSAVQQTVLRTFGGYHAVRGHLADLQAGNVPPKDKPSAFHFGLLNVLANNFKELCDAYDALYDLYTAALQERGKLVSRISAPDSEMEELIRRRHENNFLKSLMGREDWLTKEIRNSNGGYREHLNARRAECAYIRERFSSLFSESKR